MTAATAAPSKRAVFLIFTIAFLNTMGMTIVMPIVPFLVSQYVKDPANVAFWVGVLISAYAACAFLAAPALGALSDRIGRKPVLLVSLVGSAIGFVVFGIGGSLAILFAGRVIDGLTGGNISTIFAYIADVTPPEERGSRFGMLGAVTGVGFMMGPAIGGLLSKYGLSVPVFVAAAVTALTALLIAIVVPESLDKAHRTESFSLADVHPFAKITEALTRPNLRWLLLGVFAMTVPMAGLQSNISVLAKDTLSWGPAQVGLLLFCVGIIDILVQGGLVRFLLPRIGERGVVAIGLAGQGLGYLIIGLVAHAPVAWMFIGGALLFSASEGGTGPALHALISQAVSHREQGWVMGGLQSMNSAARVIGPLLAGLLYSTIGHSAPYLFGLIVIVGVAIVGRRKLGPAPAHAEA